MSLLDVLKRDRRALSRFLSQVENQRESVAPQLAQLYHAAAESIVIGVTGPPGSGKSALVAAITKLLRGRDLKVAIVAVDPTSPFTGGAILGDRFRMGKLAGDEGVFIRSMASRGQLGGLAWRTQDIVRVLAAAGFQRVIVETVGAGQSEVEVARLAHSTVVVQAPGAGDDVQAIKAGILEAADILVVNKSDLPGAESCLRALKAMMDLGHPTKTAADGETFWIPPIIATSAQNGAGLKELVAAIDAHCCHLHSHDALRAHQRTQLSAEVMGRLRDSVLCQVFDSITDEELAGIIEDATRQRIEPQQAVDQLLNSFEISRRRSWKACYSLRRLEAQAMAKVPGAKYLPVQANNVHQEEQQISSTMRFGSMKIFSGSASQALGQEIADYICDVSAYNLKPGDYTRTIFSNENIFIKLEESVRGKDVYLVQTMASPVHENFMEMLIMIDALKRDSAWRINLVVPYMSYTRSDKKDQPRVPITARLVANMMETAGVDRYMTIDLHSGQIQGFFNIPGDVLTAFHLLSDYVKQKLDAGELDDLVVVATDLGFAKQGRNWAETLGVPLAFVEKRRVNNAESPRALSLIGSVQGKNVLLVDDEVNTAASIVNAVNVVRDYGAKDVLFAFTHPFFSDLSYQRFANLDLREIIFTNTLPICEDLKLTNMTVLSIAPLLGEVILRAHEGRSVGALFNE